MKRDPEEEVPLLPIDEYLGRILDAIQPLPTVHAPLFEALGSVASEEIRAPRDLPPFASSAMDGYAVRAADTADATDDRPVRLGLLEEVRIGRATSVVVGTGQAAPISTGAIVPEGADAVIPVELTSSDGDGVLVHRALASSKHVRPAGEDVREGDVVIEAGKRLFAPDIGVLASCGFASVPVHGPLHVGVISTGDELVRPGDGLRDGQIFDSNNFTLTSAIREAGIVAIDCGTVSDEPDALVDALDEHAPTVHAFVCSGGVSMGERDPVKRAFEGESEISFFSVGMQPGRPQAFGHYRSKPFFGLPGNPISVYVSFEMFVRPALMKMTRRTDTRPAIEARFEGTLEGPRTRARIARVRVRREGDTYVATLEGGHQSNLIATFARADGLLRVDAGTTIADGDLCKVTLIRDL